MKNKCDISLVLAIVFASVIVSGSLVFFGMKTTCASEGAAGLDAIADAVDDGISRYVNRMEEEQGNQMQVMEEKEAEMSKNVPKVTGDDHIYGSKNAEISLIEYSDYLCPFCYHFHATAKKLADESDGKINWVYRHYAIPSHDPIASNIAHAGECIAEIAGNDKFWKFTDEVFAKYPTEGRVINDETLQNLVNEMGINKSKYASCMDSGKYFEKIRKQRDEGADAGVSGTPGNILINNKTGETVAVKGAKPIEAFLDAVKKL